MKLTNWKVFLIFLPGIIAFIISASSMKFSSIATFFFFTTCGLVTGVQSYFAINFNRFNKQSFVFNLNAILPLIFWITMWITSLFSLFNTHNEIINGPIKLAEIRGIYNKISILLLVHAFITFYFVNILYVSFNIKKIKNDEKAILEINFLNPIKLLVKISLLLMLSAMVIAFILDIIFFISNG